MTSSQYVLYVLGYTRATKVKIKNNDFDKEIILINNFNCSSNLSLKLEIDKQESLVIVG